MPQQMRAHGFRDSGSLSRFPARLPQNFGRDGLVGAGAVDRPGEHVGLRLHPAPVLTQRLKHLWAQRHVAVLAAFALPDVDQHAGAVDILDLEAAQFSPPHAR